MYKRWALNYHFLIFDFKDGMKNLGSRYIIILISFSLAYAKLIKIMMLTAAMLHNLNLFALVFQVVYSLSRTYPWAT